jgi:DNA polymerase-3 subunit beta
MKFIAEQPALARAADIACPLAPNNSPIPILSHVLIEAGDALRLVGNDLDMEAATEVAADIAATGALAVDAGRFRAFVKGVSSGARIEATMEGDRLRLRAGRATALFSALPAGDFPRFGTHAKFRHEFDMDGTELSRLLAGTAFAASTEETRYYLCGVFLEFGAELSAVATNGHVLSRRRSTMPAGAEGAPPIILPAFAVKMIGANFGAECRVSINEELIRVTKTGLVVTSKLVQGTFPDWRRVAPQPVRKPHVVERRRLLSIVANARSAAETGTDGKRAIALSFDDGTLTVEAKSTAAEFSDTMDIPAGTGAVRVGFHSGYLTAALESFSSETVEAHGADSGAPWLFCAPNEHEEFAVVMPMRI